MANGEVEGQSLVQIYAQRGGDYGRAGKLGEIDSLLWRAARVDEPYWDGKGISAGHPGWHIECATFIAHYLEGKVHVQGGGRDLLFPHHAMTQAHLEALGFADPFIVVANVGMVGYQGEKMSKSLGNIVFVSHLRQAGVDPRAIKIAIYANHYRQDWQWNDEGITQANQRLALWQEAVAISN